MSVQTERLEREAESTRQRLSATIDELRGRLTPGQVLDEVTGYARDGIGGDFVRNLGRDMARNPIPVALAGAGLAWLMLARNGHAQAWPESDAPDYADGGYEGGRTDTDLGSVAADAADFAAGVTERATDATDCVADRASSMGDGIADMAAAAREKTRGAYRSARERAHDLRDSVDSGSRRAAAGARNLGRSFTELCREQPLVLAGVGIALGALLGTLLPRTATEDQLMGESADEVKDRGAALASESYESAAGATREAESRPRSHEPAGREGERLPTGDERGPT